VPDVVGQAEQGAIEHVLGELADAVAGDAVDLADEQGERLLEAVQRVEVDALEDLLEDDLLEQARGLRRGEQGRVDLAAHDTAPWE
jgi:hypothetical protein